MSVSSWKRGAGFFGIGVALLLVIGLFVGDDNSNANEVAPTTEPPSQEEDIRECPDSWLIVQSDNENNRWFADGIQEIREAATPDEAREAARTWLDLVRRDPELLAGAAAYFTDSNVDPSALVDGKCASAEAEKLTTEIELAIADAKVTPEEAPENGVNSGVNGDGNVVASAHAGITGDRKAVKVETKDGKTIWILARCGNPVVVGKPPVPKGPTDQPPPDKPEKPKRPDKPKKPDKPDKPDKPKEKPKCPDGQPIPENGLCPKDPTKSVNNNPEVPDQVKKTHPSPDNQSEIDKGPREPIDSPTGCVGRCDEDDGFDPPPTTTPRPDQGRGDSQGGTNTTTPPTTQAPAPAPPTTAPPATNPPPPPPGSF